MKKYKIEFEEIDDPEYSEISDWFNSFDVNIWEDDEFIGLIKLNGVNKIHYPIMSLLRSLHRKIKEYNPEYGDSYDEW